MDSGILKLHRLLPCIAVVIVVPRAICIKDAHIQNAGPLNLVNVFIHEDLELGMLVVLCLLPRNARPTFSFNPLYNTKSHLQHKGLGALEQAIIACIS